MAAGRKADSAQARSVPRSVPASAPPRRRDCRYGDGAGSGAVVRVNFIPAKGARIAVEGAEGARLLEVGQAAGMALEGTCEGQMACSTCHVVVATEWFDRLRPASADEEDM